MGRKMQLSLFTAAILIGTTVRAHHSVTTHFDMTRSIEIRGVVVDFKLRSPHASLVVDGQSYVDGVVQDATVQRWEVESSAAPGLRAMGIDNTTFKPGDRITVVAAPNRQPDFRFVNSSNFVDASGKRYSRATAERVQNATADSVASLAGIARMAGRWSAPGAFARQEGTPLPLNEVGRSAREQYDAKASPANTCEAMNIPDIFNAPYLFDVQIEGNVLVIHNQPWEVRRRIPLTGEEIITQPAGAFGVVRGRIEDTTVILDSDRFPPSRWGLGGATQFLGSGTDLPSSAQKKVSERFSLSADGLTMYYEYTLEDPTYLSEPFNGRLQFTRVAATTPMYPYTCEEESASMFSRSPQDARLQVGD
jgi:Family of unknown function (DUF6152)